MADTLTTFLDALVAKNRGLISVVFPLVGSFLLLASAAGVLPGVLAFNPWLLLLGVVVMRSPLIVGVLPVTGRRAVIGIGILAAYSYAIELIGLHTGWPYGAFSYSVSLGPMIGGVPVALPLFFLPLVMNAYLLVLLISRWARKEWVVRVAAVIAVVVAMDVVLDPGAVGLGFWSYSDTVSGSVPLSNYLGWVLSAAVTTLVLDHVYDTELLVDALENTSYLLDDLVSFVLLWSIVNAWYGNLVSLAVASVFGVVLVTHGRFDLPISS